MSRSDIAVARVTELFHRPKSIALSLEFLMGNQYTREIAAALLIDVSGNLLLQRRDNVPHIIQPGKVGLFGGHREGDETFLECVVRDVRRQNIWPRWLLDLAECGPLVGDVKRRACGVASA